MTPIAPADLDALLAAGLELVAGRNGATLPAHPEAPREGEPLTHDELLEFHEQLTTNTWFGILVALNRHRACADE